MIDREELLKIVQQKGPLIPIQLKKDIGGDTMLLGAILSELASAGKIRITHMKIGGSPAYYTPGTENRLYTLTKYLNEKDRSTALKLEQKKIIKDSEVDPLTRVSLRNIRDFAKPLEVNLKGKKEIFWKWHLLTGVVAKELIIEKISPQKSLLQKRQTIEKVDVPVKKTSLKPEIKTEKKLLEQKEVIETQGSKTANISKPKVLSKKITIETVQQPLPINKDSIIAETDEFFKKIKKYFEDNQISLLEYKIIRKKSDIDFSISVPSRIGRQEYYCKAKSKKKINDGDLSSAYIQGQIRKLPVLFIRIGEITKKAKEMINKEFKGMIVKKI